MQVSPTTNLELTVCRGTNQYWITSIVLYEMLLLAILIYLSFRNSQISDITAYMEEGSAVTRMVVAITIVTLPAVAMFYFLHTDLAKYYRAAHWLHVVYTVIGPVLYLLVFFIPKVYTVCVFWRSGRCLENTDRRHFKHAEKNTVLLASLQ